MKKILFNLKERISNSGEKQVFYLLNLKKGSDMKKVYFMHVWNLQIIGKNVKNEKKKYHTGD